MSMWAVPWGRLKNEKEKGLVAPFSSVIFLKMKIVTDVDQLIKVKYK